MATTRERMLAALGVVPVATAEITIPLPTITTNVVPIVASHVSTRSDLLTDSWTWEGLRDYLVSKITDVTGQRPTMGDLQMSGICKGFIRRWGDQAPVIAKAAFELHKGYWRGAPIQITRFTESNDIYFANVIAQRLAETA